MESLPIASTVLRIFAGGTILFQIGLLAAVPIPSPVSSRRVWAQRAGEKASPVDDRPTEPFAARLLPIAALAGLLAVVIAVIWPGGAGDYLLPAGTRAPGWLAAISGACLVAGNVLIAVAVFTLNRCSVFNDAGQSEALVTGGVFGLMRHPIVGGLGLLYLGFFLVLPSPLVLVGLICFGWHQQRRLAAEEVLLENRFGVPYRQYRCRVGRFWPRWPRHQ
ncbi:MAG: isoprenylcysteine carboxylmethyltransferase family protein [Desulfobacteraceae bacterium]|nr:isoprenylcysteine carboxylmethyltransferase family protein [Desulfobacteraceae bacterium]MBC2751622.1 isoprenylcysteine carboxylmethyltransferase family protein [Desulfobacteraceae bacterium]